MADFQEQVMGITGLTIDGSSTDPSRSEFSTFLNDGVIDVTSKSILINPKTKDDFSRVSAEQTSNGFNPGTNKIISVIREAGVANDWRDCKKISFGLQSKVIDVDSLYYASQYNPAYMVSHNRTIDVFPEPNSGGVNGFKVLYVNSSPEETDGTALDHASTGIKWFPNDKVYLVVIYAAIKSLESAMSAKGIPTVGGASEELTATISTGNTTTDVSDWFDVAGDFIQTEEDSELAAVQIQKISAYMQAYQAQLQGNSTDYQWMQARHGLLQAQYDKAFMRPPQPQQAQGARA